MDWTDRFDLLSQSQQLALSTMAAERVLPLAGGLLAFEDGLRLVWMQTAGRATTKLELTHVLNDALDAAQQDATDDTARRDSVRAIVCVLEAALHNPEACREAVGSALAAAHAVDALAGNEELQWLNWALRAAAGTPTPSRATFQDADAPVSSWPARFSSADLPLFDGHAR